MKRLPIAATNVLITITSLSMAALVNLHAYHQIRLKNAIAQTSQTRGTKAQPFTSSLYPHTNVRIPSIVTSSKLDFDKCSVVLLALFKPTPRRTRAQPLPASPNPHTNANISPIITSCAHTMPSLVEWRQSYTLSNFINFSTNNHAIMEFKTIIKNLHLTWTLNQHSWAKKKRPEEKEKKREIRGSGTNNLEQVETWRKREEKRN